MRMLAAVLPMIALAANAQPAADHHQHLFHPADTGLPAPTTVTAADLIAWLDTAGIRRAVVLSAAYQFANPNRPAVDDEYEKTRVENDWTGAQAARYPDRLRAFCGFNPLRDYALKELSRCAADPRLRYGIKLHFGNSDVDLDNPEHIRRLREIFREADRRGMAIVAHVRSSVTRKRPWGARQARVLLTEVLPEAPRVPVQIAHLCGAGSYDAETDDALGVFADAIAKRDRRVAHLYFDVSGITELGSKEKGDRIASRIRQIGLDRVLFGSDGAIPGNSPREYWTRFRQLALTEAEFRAIEGNVAPYLRE